MVRELDTVLSTIYRLLNVKDLPGNRLILVDTGGEVSALPNDPYNVSDAQVGTPQAANGARTSTCGHVSANLDLGLNWAPC